RVCAEFVGLSDLAPTFLEAAGMEPDSAMTGQTLLPVFSNSDSNSAGQARDRAFFAMERHDGCRQGGKGYPCRAMRTAEFLFILNYEPDRWPAGDPDAAVCARAIPFGEVDSSPTKQLLMDRSAVPEFQRFHELAFAKRPAEELYDLKQDAGQLRNLAADPKYTTTRNRLRGRLEQYLIATEDPRAQGRDAPWDFYPYYGLRKNKDWSVDKKP
ncbi:MAG: hypothetical protein ABGZ17_22375, partial [Planctomycetaceae bacterium]